MTPITHSDGMSRTTKNRVVFLGWVAAALVMAFTSPPLADVFAGQTNLAETAVRFLGLMYAIGKLGAAWDRL